MNEKRIHYHLRWQNPEDIKKCLMENRKITENGCWEWTRAPSMNGYGMMRIDGIVFKSHRVSKVVFDGFDIKSSLFVCHHCDNPPCFNPKHLFIGTRSDNANDMFSKNRGYSAKGEYNPKAKLTESQVHRIFLMEELGETHEYISSFFPIGRAMVSHILRKESWRHLHSRDYQ